MKGTLVKRGKVFMGSISGKKRKMTCFVAVIVVYYIRDLILFRPS